MIRPSPSIGYYLAANVKHRWKLASWMRWLSPRCKSAVHTQGVTIVNGGRQSQNSWGAEKFVYSSESWKKKWYEGKTVLGATVPGALILVPGLLRKWGGRKDVGAQDNLIYSFSLSPPAPDPSNTHTFTHSPMAYSPGSDYMLFWNYLK